ncbi:MAG: sugar ABC transporter permease [Acutalibacteraceae bacterium]|nr:sugar ABC transporter permease [Acutalibacteraceae bacterium]
MSDTVVKKPKKSIQARGIEALKERYGWICVAHWVFGLVVFFILPILQSLFYTFCDVTLQTGRLDTKWIGFENIKYIFTENADYSDNLLKSVGTFAYSFPIILVLSLILALMLNQKFKGRVFFRAIYFLPVIIASGVILGTIIGDQSISSTSGTDEAVSANMINVKELVEWTGLPEKIGGYFQDAINKIMNLVWQCGVQIILFIAGMQSIPDLYYEVSKVEGATAWEEFWYITFPSLSRVIVLVTVFTMVELMTSQTDKVIAQAYNLISSQQFGRSSAMLWVYFLIIGAILGAILGAFNRFCAKKWE